MRHASGYLRYIHMITILCKFCLIAVSRACSVVEMEFELEFVKNLNFMLLY